MDVKDLATIGVTFIIVAIIIGIGVTITDEVKADLLEVSSISNETVSGLENHTTNQSVARAPDTDFTLTTSSVVIHNNSAGAYLFPSTSYVVYTDGVISWLNISNPTVTVNISYDYEHATGASSALRNGTEGMAELSSWLPTIALIIAAAIIIGLVIVYFSFRRI